MLTVLLVFVVQLGSRFAFASRRSMSMRELIRSHQRVVMERAEWLEPCTTLSHLRVQMRFANSDTRILLRHILPTAVVGGVCSRLEVSGLNIPQPRIRPMVGWSQGPCSCSCDQLFCTYFQIVCHSRLVHSVSTCSIDSVSASHWDILLCSRVGTLDFAASMSEFVDQSSKE